jgi:hypothetical protein
MAWVRGFVDNPGDTTHGFPYFYNEELQITQWEIPEGFTFPEEGIASSASEMGERTASNVGSDSTRLSSYVFNQAWTWTFITRLEEATALKLHGCFYFQTQARESRSEWRAVVLIFFVVTGSMCSSP